MISITIVLFCLSMEVVNTVNDDYVLETNRTLYGYKAEPYITVTDLDNKVGNTTSIEGDIEDLSKPAQNFLAAGVDIVTSTVDAFTTGLKYLIDGAQYLLDVLFKSTWGFDTFIQYMGRSPNAACVADKTSSQCPLRWFPEDIAFIIKVMVNFNHFIALYQIYSKNDLRGGA